MLGAAPMLLLKDIDMSSEELNKLQKSTISNLQHLIGNRMFPAVGIFIALDDYAMFRGDLLKNCYMDSALVSFVQPFLSQSLRFIIYKSFIVV